MRLSSFFSQKYNVTKAIVLFLFTGALSLTACTAGEDTSMVSLLKDGTVETFIVEDFDKSYYDKAELQQMILEEAVSYNLKEGEGTINVDKITVEDGIARVRLTYASPADYASFNDGVFFVGSVQEAQEEGYDLNKVFTSAEDTLVTAAMSDILAMQDAKILITDMKEPVTVDGKVLYISNNVITDKKCKTVSFDEESEEVAYIIYK